MELRLEPSAPSSCGPEHVLYAWSVGVRGYDALTRRGQFTAHPRGAPPPPPALPLAAYAYDWADCARRSGAGAWAEVVAVHGGWHVNLLQRAATAPRGLGAKVLGAALRAAAAAGPHDGTVTLCVVENAAAAAKLCAYYEALGFARTLESQQGRIVMRGAAAEVIARCGVA